MPHEQLSIKVLYFSILTFCQKITFKTADSDNEDIVVHLLNVYNKIITHSVCAMQWLQ